MLKDKSYKKADYPNAIPCWRKHPIKFKEKRTQQERVLASLNWEKLGKLLKNNETKT